MGDILEINKDPENQKYVSTGEIIAKYNRDNKDFPVDDSDAIEWIAEVARDVGDYDEFVRQMWLVPTANMQALAPCGIYKIEAVKSLDSGDALIPYEWDGVFIRPLNGCVRNMVVEFLGLPMDEKGYPMILADQKKPAVMYLFLMGHAKKMWLTDQLSDQKYTMLKREYEIAVGEARGSFRNFSKNKREDIVRVWQRMITHFKQSRPFTEGIIWNINSTSSQLV